MEKKSKFSLLQTAFAASFLALGIAIGLCIPFQQLRDFVVGTSDSVAEEEHHHDHAEEEGFDVTVAAQKTLGLVRERPTIGDYSQQISLPAIVRERPAVSNLHASSKLDGIVRKIYVAEGQSVQEGDPLVDLELTGESLASSQSILLDSIKQLEIVRSSIERLSPIAKQGGVPRKDLIEQQNEQKRLQALIESKRQELLVQGFSQSEIDSIENDGKLIRMMTIRVPDGIRPQGIFEPPAQPKEDRFSQISGSSQTSSIAAKPVSASTDDPWVYSIEKLYVSPGSMTKAGESLCDLSFHETLLLEGQAYESDLSILTRLMQSGEGVTVQMGSDDNPSFYDGTPILYLDNHIDPDLQVIRFYLELENTVTAETKNQYGERFRSWKFRPEQRGHVLLPSKKWEGKFVLPSEAVAKDGLDHIVFAISKVHIHPGEPAHSVATPIRVTLLYEDRRTAVVATDGDLSEDEFIAMNNAYMLLLQMNNAAGGVGHSHDHEH